MPDPTPTPDYITDWPLLIAVLALAFIAGAMVGLSFAPTMVTFQ